MVAGDKEQHLDKIKDLKCDVCMINLEDGVFDKTYALNLLLEKFLSSGLKSKDKQVVVRINSLNTTGVDEIDVINTLKPDAIRVPKIKTVDDVKLALELIDDNIDIHLSIETKEAFSNLQKFNIDKRITTVYLGILDLSESLSIPQSLLKLSNPTIDYILSKFLIDSRIAGLYPVSFTYQDYKNVDEFTLWCKKVKSMGYTAKSCISPTQVEIVNKIFKFDKQMIERAYYIRSAFEEQKELGFTGFCDDKYGFIDETIYKDALLVLNSLKS
jgi:citrate lyase subunit beta/citryl-CoA lyase